MSPRPGGEADKFGARYEGRWTVRYLLYVLLGRADSVTVEEVGQLGEGAEFTVRRGNSVEVHQVKRQIRNSNEWSISALSSAGVLKSALRHVAASRGFHFVSTVPARLLDELTDRARRSPNPQSFLDHMLTDDLRPSFDYLGGDAGFGSVETAWQTLQGMHVRWLDERDVVDVNNGYAGVLLKGAAPPLATAALGSLVLDNLNVELDADTIEGLLGAYGLKRARLLGSATLAQNVKSALEQWKASVARELLEPAITANEASDIWGALQGDGRVLFLIGAAGGGKSAAAYATVQEAESAGWPVLALRLDRVGSFTSPAGLGQQIGLDVSPVSGLAAVSGDDPCLLVIDQVDAVSFASGRMPESYDVVAGLVREASGFPNMRVLLACRKFDVDNDERIRSTVKSPGVSQVEVGPLTDEQVGMAVRAMRLDEATLTTEQRKLLSSPLNLVLLHAIADQNDVFSFSSSRDLFDSYWDRKRRNCRQGRSPAPRFNEVIRVIVDAMSERQQLATAMTVLDQDDLAEDAQVLESEGILVRDGRQYAFFHETFFDYAFARQWIERGSTLVDFLLLGEQELFRRGQVRQALNHLRADDPDRFIVEAEGLLRHPGIRFHIKDVVIALLRALSTPTSADWSMIKRVMATEPEFIERMWLALRTLPWFDCLDAEGEIADLLNRDHATQTRALEIFLGGIKDRTDRIADLIAPHAGRTANYADWLRWVTRFADLHSSRKLIDLVIDSVRRGEYIDQGRDLWTSTYNLASYKPTWAVDLLSAYLSDQPTSFDLDSHGRVALLRTREHAAAELTTESAEKASGAFCDSVLPYIQKVALLTEYDHDERPIKDRQFSYHALDGTNPHELEDAVLRGARTAMRNLVLHDQQAAKPTLETLASDPHETCQWLLYEALQVGGETYADWAAELLLEGRHRLVGTYPSSGSLEATARLLRAIGSYIDSETFSRLEQAILQLRVPSERRPTGWCQFSLLASLEEARLSEQARRRLGELQRLFNANQPPPRPMFTSGFIKPPISQEAASHMKDDHWLRAFAKYDTDRHDWTTGRGGVRELSNLLQNETTADPDRFARLARRLTTDIHSAYANGILLGLGNTQTPGSADIAFDAIRHIASLNNTDNDQWLSWPLQRYQDAPVPDDVVRLLVDRALHSPSPVEDRWDQENVGDLGAGERIASNGINSARGSNADMLGYVLVHDVDGHRTELVAPFLSLLAGDPSVPVRSCVAHLIASCLRHARAEAVEAYGILVQADDRLLTTAHAIQLAVYIGFADPPTVEPVIWRMLRSEFGDVRKFGGQLAAFAGLELSLTTLFETARDSNDGDIRQGMATVCAQRLPHTSSPDVAARTLQAMANAPEAEVREAVAGLAAALRGESLRPFGDVLVSLIDSASFEPAVNQLLITLEQATDRVDDLALTCAARFVDSFGADVGNISTSAAGNANEVGRLVLRAYAQSGTAASRSAALDLIDTLLLFAAYGVDELVGSAERS